MLPEPDLTETAQCLLEHGAALRSLGRRLLDEAAADDLVQDTYVAAVEGRAPRGVLAAWLLGIGRRLALLTRRREGRRRAREQRVGGAAVAPSAVDAAAAAECMRQIATAVQELPETYRTVIVMRFWRDLPPRAIAAQLGVPPNTVQSRLQRALGLLRQRLDAQGRAAWVGPLVACVRGKAAAGWLATWIGVTSMGTKTNVAAAVGLLGAAVWIVLPQPTSSAAPPAALAEPADAAAGTAASAFEQWERGAVDERTTLVGRCVAAGSGAPLAGCRVVLVQERDRGDASTRSQPQVLVTDAGGRFAFAPVPSSSPHRLLCGGEEYVGIERAWPSWHPGTLDLGDVVLQLGARVVGTVRNVAGQGVDRAVFELERVDGGEAAAPATATGFVPCRLPPMYSRADGVLQQSGGALAAGAWRVQVRSEHMLRSAGAFRVEPGQRQVSLDLVVATLAEQPAIAGGLVDEAGAPVVGVTLRTSDGSTARSGPDGAFSLHRRGDGEAPVRLALAPDEACALVAPDNEYAWGSRGHRVVVKQPAGVWLIVVDAATGDPVTDYGVWLIPLESGQWTRGLIERGRHEHGRLHLGGVRPGRYRVVVQPDDAVRMPSEPIEVAIGAAATLRIEVERGHVLAVEVRTGGGEPVANSRVDLFRQEGEGDLEPARIGGWQLAYQTVVSTASFPVVSSARTDELGRAHLLAPSRGRLGLRVRGAHVPHIEHPLPPAVGDASIVVVVERGASVSGTLTPPGVLRDLVPDRETWQQYVVGGEFGDPARPWPTITLRSAGQARRVVPARIFRGQPGFAVQDYGSFRIDGIPPGDWLVELEFGIGAAWHFREIGRLAALVDGERREVVLDIGTLRPGELRATVRLDGAPVAGREIRFGNGWFRTDGSGRVVARVPSGAWHVELAGDKGGMQGAVEGDERIAVGAGEVVERTIELTRRRLRVHVLRADGTPAARQTFGIDGEDVTTDADGWFTLDPAPATEFCLLTSLADAVAGRSTVRSLSGPLRMPLDRKSAEIEVRLH